MKTKTFILSFLMMFCSVVFGQNQSGWNQVSNHFDEEMVVITQIMIDNDLQGSNIELGAFCGNELRGSAFPDATDNNIVYIMVKGNENGEKITFRLYDHNQGKELDYVIENALTFEADARVGSISGISNGLLREEYRSVFTSVASTNGVRYGTLQGAINACTTGDNTVTLLANISDDVTVKQVEGVNIIINGNNNEYSGTFYIHGNARSNGAETLTFQNVNFTTSEASHYFIDSNETTSAERYAHNVTVEECNFTATGDAKNTAVAMRIRQGFNIAIDGGTFTDLHSALQAYGNAGISVTGITLNGKNGISAGTSNDVVITNSNITATGYGVRADGTSASAMTVANNTIEANIPVIVRKTNADYILNVDNCDLTAVAGGFNTKGYQVVLTSGDDEAKFAIPTSKATAAITGDVKTYGLEAKAGDVCYTRFEDALEAAKTNGDDITILQYVLRNTEVTYDLGADKGVKITTGKYVNTTAFLFDANATVKNADFYSEDVYAFFVDSGAKLIIEDGKYHAAATVAQVTKGSLEVLGGEFSIEPDDNGSYEYLLNCKDNNYPANAAVTVKGGKYYNWNPEDNKAEGEHTNFCAEGYTSVSLGNNVYEVTGAVAKIGETLYATFDAAYTAAKAGDVIELLRTAVITNSNPWINYSKKKNITVKAEFGEAAFRVQDGAYVWFGGMTIESNDYCIIVGASDGSSGANVEIYGGTYNGETSAISVTKGDVKIMDGTFKVEPYQGSYEYTINCVDANYKNGADVSIQGGKFYNFNPMNNAAEGVGTNFVINDYATAKDADNYWHVGEVIAKIGETPYLSLTDAVEAAQNNETITLAYREDSYSGNGIVINKSITIDFNGKTYSINKAVGSTGTESNGFQILAGNTVTLKNGTLNVARNRGSQFYILVQNYANLTVEGMNLDGTLLDKYSKTYGDSYVLSNNSGNVNIINTTIKANNDGDLAFAFDVCDSKDYTVKPVVYVKGNDTKVEGKIEVAETLKDNLHIQGGTYDFDVEEAGYCDNAYFTKDNGNDTWTVEGPYVAQIGETRYATLAAAVSAATAGETIEIIANVTEDVTVKKNLTIDGANNNYTGNISVTGKNIKVTVKNVNFINGTGYAITTNTIGSITVENCTVKDYGFGFLYANKSTSTVVVKNVTVNGANYGMHWVYGSNATLENVTMTDVTNGLYIQNYAAKTITVKNSEITSIAIWERSGYSGVQTFKFEGDNTVGTLSASQYAKYVLTATDATLTAPEGSTVTTTVDGYVTVWNNGVYSVQEAVAKIGETYYATLAEAVEAAQDDATVVLLQDVELENTLTIAAGKVVTLDLNGKVVSGVSATAGTTAVVTNKGNLTVMTSVEGGKITSQALTPDTNWGGEGEPSFPSYANNTVRNEGTFTLVSGTIENTSAAGGATYAIDNYNGSTTNIEGGLVYCQNNIAIRLFCGDNIALNVNGGEVKGTRALWIQLASSNASVAPNVDVNITDGTLTATGNGEYKLAIYSYSYGNDMKNVEINISGGTFNGDIALTGGSNKENVEKLNITGGTFNGKDGDVYSYGVDAKAIEAITITGGTFNSNYAEKYAEDNNHIFVANADGKYVVTEGAYVAAIGDVRYSSVAKAVAAATSGQTITLIANVTEDVTVNKNLTIDGANNNYTGNISVTGKNIKVTVKNVNFINGTGYAITTNTIGSITVENCTVKDYGFGFLYANKSTSTVVVKNVTVNGANYGMHWVYGSNATLENVTMTDVTNGLYIQNYAAKTITVKNSEITSIAIWERSGYSGVQTFKFEGDNTVGTLSASQYAKYVLTATDATLTAPEGSTVTTTVEGHTVKHVERTYKVIPAVAQIGNEIFASIQDAIDAAKDGNTIVVLRNINLNETALGLLDNAYSTYFKVEGKTVTIDLNGKTISGEFNSTPMLVGLFSTENNGHLTLVDNSDEGTALVDLKSGNDQVYALIVNYEPGCSITIDGGTYKLDKAKDAIVYTGASLNEGGVTIEDGIFELGNVGTGTNGQPWIFNVKGQNFRGVQVNGGTFNSDINHQFWANEVYVPETLALRNNGNGTWTVYEAEAYVVETASSTGASPRKVGYETLTEALAVAMDKNYTTVGLSKDITTDKVYTIKAGETVTFDLNGKTIAGTDNTSKNFGLFQNNGTLTVNDATNSGKMTVNATTNSGWNRYSAVISNNPGATLTVNGGTIEHLGGTDMAYGIDALTNGNIGDVNTTINGGTIKSTYRAVRQFLNSDSKENNLTVNDGTLVGANKSIFFHDPSTKANNGNITVSADAKLYGDVYLFVTAGSTVWPVEVSIANAAFDVESTVVTGNVPETYTVDQVNAIWTVLRVSTQTLVSGWNWFSHYVEGDVLGQLKDQLSEEGIAIKTLGAFISNQGGVWPGNLSTTSVEKMYKINVNEQIPVNVSGKIVDPSEHPITLGLNWNWIGYPMNVSVSLNEAYANVAQDGDFIKTNGAFAEYSADDQSWHGNLRSLTPGVGYMYFNAEVNTTDVFTYSYSQSRGSVEANITAENNYWSVEAAQYANNMTMVAMLDVNGANYEVAAFVNGEVRGSARPIYVESLDAYMFFLTINGDEVEEVTFKCYDIDTDTEYALSNVINYSNDAILGSLKNPYTLSRGTLGLEELSNNFNIYPNPTTTDREINLTTTCDKVEVFNALGVKVVEYQNVDTIDALEAAGIYVIRVTNNGNVKHCRLVVK